MKRIIGLLMVLGLVVGVGCGGDKDSPTGPSNEVTKGPDGQTLEVVTRKWENGNIKVESQYFKDIEGKMVQHGYYKEYYESGKVEWEVNYLDGKLEGKSVEYYESGKVKREGNLVDGKLEGKWVSYYESGKVFIEGNIVDGKREGKWVGYDESGEVFDEDIWKDGECIEMCEGDE